MMSKRFSRFIQCMIGLGLAVYLAEKLASGQISYYINLRFVGFTILGIAGLMVMVVVGLWPMFEEHPDPQASPVARRKGFLVGMTFIPLLSALMGLSAPVITVLFILVLVFGSARLYVLAKTDPQGETSISTLPFGALLLLTVPLIFGLLVPVRPLSTSSLSTKGMGLSAPSAIGQQSVETMQVAPDERTVLDWVKLFNFEEDLTGYIDEPVDVVGFVYHDPRVEAGQFMVGRFIITCCVADAFAVGMVVDSPDGAGLEENAWVRVTGKLDVTTVEGREVPLIHAQSIVLIQAPAQPYLYP